MQKAAGEKCFWWEMDVFFPSFHCGEQGIFSIHSWKRLLLLFIMTLRLHTIYILFKLKHISYLWLLWLWHIDPACCDFSNVSNDHIQPLEIIIKPLSLNVLFCHVAASVYYYGENKLKIVVKKKKKKAEIDHRAEMFAWVNHIQVKCVTFLSSIQSSTPLIFWNIWKVSDWL